ncbi:MAG TPA: MFS transporter [Rectinemataceae bacterium]|nr:MFS transporter [Rectinemataceae bacterium]
MAAPLSPNRLRSARQSFNVFNFLNSFSFVFVSGSFITLFAIRMGASNAIVGVLNAIAYSTFFMMPIGKRLVHKKPLVWIFGWAWVARYTALLPILFAPLFAARGHSGAAIGLLIAGAAGFSFFRGVALIGNNPVVGFLASGGGEKPRSDRGQYMVSNSLINSLASMMGGLLVSLFLGEQANPWAYAAGVGVGIATGYAGCILLLQTPEPTDYSPEKTSSLIETTREAIKEEPFRRFIVIFMVLAFVSGMGRSFLPVYAKEVFAQGDDAVMVYALIASIGSVVMGLISRLVVDRLGSKPLFIIFTAVGLASFLPIAILPGGGSVIASGTVVALFLAFIHFVANFGFAGEENSGQTYYFTLVPKEKTLDLSVVYYFSYGLGGAIGSGLGGLILDGFIALGLSVAGSYRLLYALLCVILVLALYSMQKLKRLGSRSVSQSLGVMFSPRDLKAFDLLARLDRSANPDQEIKLIQELGHSTSLLSQDELIDYLHSPRFEVRMEALLAFETMPHLSPKVIRSLMKEAETHTFTTSYVAARILGKSQSADAIPILRKATEAEDYMLQGTAMIALARIGDVDSIPLIESILTRTRNPRVKISAVFALELMQSKASLPVLVSSLRRDDPPAFVSDEIILAMASIMGIMKEFYPLYSAFIEDEEQGLALLESTARDIIVDERTMEAWKKGLAGLFDSAEPDGRKIASFIVKTGNDPQTEVMLGEALLEAQLGYRGGWFLAAAYPLFVKHRGS